MPYNPKCLDNLKPSKPGMTNNPNGRPKGVKSFKTRLMEIAETEITYNDLDGKKIKTEAGQALALSLFAKAIYGSDVPAAKAILEHTEVKKLHIGSDEDNPLRVRLDPVSKELMEQLGVAIVEEEPIEEPEDI